MSGESSAHINLVERLIDQISHDFRHGRNLVIFADHRSYRRDQPLQIGNHKPDVYSHDVPCTFRVLGEAKTVGDLESKRTYLQVEAFLDHLSIYPGSYFYFATTWAGGPLARRLLKTLSRSGGIPVCTKLFLF
jgi:hypothetical protein